MKRPLYAIASERPRRINGVLEWVPTVTHVHAEDSARAKIMFLQDPIHRYHRIVAIGPVIGYHVEDEHGEVLRA